MKYYDLSEGNFKTGKLTENEMWEAFHWLFSDKSVNDSSYKFIFLKSIIDCMDRKDEFDKISFDILFERFTSISWNLVLKYGISQKIKSIGKKATVLEQELQDFLVLNGYDRYVPIEEIDDEKRRKLIFKIKQGCKRYVIGALFGDMKELLYSFSKKEQWIKLNPQMEVFVIKHKNVIESLNYCKWASFYEKINSDETKNHIISLLDKDFEKRKNESIYRALLAYEFEREMDMSKVNTIELLFMAEDSEENAEIINRNNIEEELFQDYSNMRKYLANPIDLIGKLKRNKGIEV